MVIVVLVVFLLVCKIFNFVFVVSGWFEVIVLWRERIGDWWEMKGNEDFLEFVVMFFNYFYLGLFFELWLGVLGKRSIKGIN